MKGYGISHKGKLRTINQDSFLVLNKNVGLLSNLYIVADGMGGHLAGEVASKRAIMSFYNYVSNNSYESNLLDFLIEGAQKANSCVYESALNNEKLRGMGTTFTSLSISGKQGYVTHVGDSRVYLINNNDIKQLTTDHSYVNELVKTGRITPQEAKYHPGKHVLTRALGTEPELCIDGFVFDVELQDKILICTDGVTNMIEEEHIKRIIQMNTLEDAVNSIVLLANENGGTDNITSILIEIEGDDDVA